MPEIAPAGKPMAISWNVTPVCWIKSPEVKPLNKDERIRLGLLIKKGSIQRPDAISQRSKKPPMITKRMIVTPKPRTERPPPLWTTGASDAVPAREVSLLILLDIEIVSACQCSVHGERYSTAGRRLRRILLAGEFQRCCAAVSWAR